jgi:hypothetical protein
VLPAGLSPPPEAPDQRQAVIDLTAALENGQAELSSIRTVSRISIERPCQDYSEPFASLNGRTDDSVKPEQGPGAGALLGNEQFWEEGRILDSLLTALIGFLRKRAVAVSERWNLCLVWHITE